jgi:hypothetical protein
MLGRLTRACLTPLKRRHQTRTAELSFGTTLRPDDSHDLRLHSADLKVEPEPASVRWKHDMFDNSVCFLEWPEKLRTKRLTIVSTLDLTHHPDGQPLPDYRLDAPAEQFPFSYALHESLTSPASPSRRHRIRSVKSLAGRDVS